MQRKNFAYTGTPVIFVISLFLFIGTAAHANVNWEQIYPHYPTHGYSDIYVADASNAFAVGSYGLINHYNGSTWSAMASPVNDVLNAVWGRSATDVYAVGNSGIIIHYNGSAWSIMSSPISDDLYSVWGFSGSGNPIYAGGRNGNILKYSGGAWSLMNTPLADGDWDYTIIYGIWGYSPTNIYAVGYKAGDNTEDIYLQSTDGSTWQKLTGPTGSEIPATVFPVSIWGDTGGLMYIAGRNGVYSLTNGGGTWTKVLSGDNIADIWGPDNNNLWAVGGNAIYFFDGVSWITQNSVYDGSSIWGSSASDVFISGSEGKILHFQGDAWSSMNVVPGFNIYGMWAESDTSVCAVGENGLILYYNGQYWKPMESTTDTNLRSVCGWGNGHFMAVGSNGTVLYFNGSTWTQVNSGTTDTLYDSWCIAPDSAFVVGSNGTILNCTGASCSPEDNGGATSTMYSVHQSSMGAYAGSDGGRLYRKDATNTWTLVSTAPTSFTINDLWGDPAFGLVAIGTDGYADGYIYSYNVATKSWTELYNSNGTSMYLQAAVGSNIGNLYVAGYGDTYPYSGQILKKDGGTFTVQKTFTDHKLYTLTQTPSGNLFTEGEGSSLLQYNGTNWIRTNPSLDLQDIWGGSINNIFIVGYYGTILNFNGASIHSMSMPEDIYFEAVFAGSNSNWACAAGESGKMFYFDGTSWAKGSNSSTEWVNDLWGAGDTVFGVGKGTILRSLDRGTTWNAMSTPSTEYLNSIWGSSAFGPIFVVGDNGTVLKYDGTSWADMANSALSYIDLYGVWGSSDNNVYAVGHSEFFLGSNESQIIHYNGSTWEESYYSYNVLPAKYLNSIWGRSENDIIAFGTPNIRRQCGRAWQEEGSPAGLPPLTKAWGKEDQDGNYHLFGIASNSSIYHVTYPPEDNCRSPWILFMPAILSH